MGQKTLLPDPTGLESHVPKPSLPPGHPTVPHKTCQVLALGLCPHPVPRVHDCNTRHMTGPTQFSRTSLIPLGGRVSRGQEWGPASGSGHEPHHPWPSVDGHGRGGGEGSWFKLGWRLQGQDLGVPWGQIPPLPTLEVSGPFTRGSFFGGPGPAGDTGGVTQILCSPKGVDISTQQIPLVSHPRCWCSLVLASVRLQGGLRGAGGKGGWTICGGSCEEGRERF